MPKRLTEEQLLEISRRAHRSDDEGTSHPDIWPLLNHILTLENDLAILNTQYNSLAEAVKLITERKAPE